MERMIRNSATDGRMNPSYLRLREELEALGCCAGDVLAVHSSLRSMGAVEGGADTVIAALSDAVGPTGTLLLPTFTYLTSYVDSFYSNIETPSCVGMLSEVFRKREGVLRTNHPTHSVALFGRLARELMEGEEGDDTPMGVHSPYRRLGAVGAKILMIGCGTAHNSYMHALEEEAGAVYALRDHQEYTVVDAEGRRRLRRIRRHNFVRPTGAVYQRYERALDVLLAGEYRISPLHGAETVLMEASALRLRVLAKMREDPFYFVDDPMGYYRR